jgi:type IV pilus assembly protein PilX
MKPSFIQHIPPGLPQRHQRGVALIISLIMLVLMTLVGMAGIRVINAEERMVSQTYDRTLAFQTAEATLREIEGRIESAGQPTPLPASACAVVSGLNVCGASNTLPRWIDGSFNQWQSASPVNHTTGISITPKYFVEYLGGNFPCSLDSVSDSNCKRYRVTALAQADTDRASVMLQSVYSTYLTSGTPTGP